MAIESLTEEQRAIRDTVRRFVEQEVMPFEPVLLRRTVTSQDASPGLTPEERRELQGVARRSGLWGVDTPQDLGGADLGPVELALVHEELGRTFVDFDFGGSAIPTLYGCRGEQRDRYLRPVIDGERPAPAIAISEAGGGSDVRGMRTSAVRRGVDWVLNGEKTWITHANTADFAIVFAATSEGGEDGITAFLVDRDLGWESAPIPMMGSRDKVGTLTFADVVVPAENVLGEVNRGFDHLMGFIYRNRAYILSAKSLGAAGRLLEMAVGWARDRDVQGRPLADRDSVQMRLAEFDIELRAAKLLVLQAASVSARGEDYRHEAYASKVYVARLVNRLVDWVLQLHGALGYARESPIERWYRDLRVERIYDGSDEVNLVSAARNLLKGHKVPGQIFP